LLAPSGPGSGAALAPPPAEALLAALVLATLLPPTPLLRLPLLLSARATVPLDVPAPLADPAPPLPRSTVLAGPPLPPPPLLPRVPGAAAMAAR
jgi:hypothetical protein